MSVNPEKKKEKHEEECIISYSFSQPERILTLEAEELKEKRKKRSGIKLGSKLLFEESKEKARRKSVRLGGYVDDQCLWSNLPPYPSYTPTLGLYPS